MSSSTPIEPPAYRLEGERLKDGWTVSSRLDWANDHSGGSFSVGYLAIRDDGTQGFLKAFDYTTALESEDPATELRRLTDAFLAERTVLEHCGERRFSQIVRILDAGTIRVDGVVTNAVSYLLFEWAVLDGRTAVTQADPADHAPMLTYAHNAAVGLSQLHSAQINHQDLKPSNLVLVDELGALSGKLSDLGRAFMLGRPAPHDDLVVAGAAAYAAPEQLYNCPSRLRDEGWRTAADLYMFGNLVSFLLTGVPFSGITLGDLHPTLRWKEWNGTFDDVLPALVDAHGRSISKLKGALHKAVSDAIAGIIDDLCYPDPRHRGDHVARGRGQNPYDLSRFITRLDLIAHRAAIHLKRPK
ncbi:MAG TPA: hypothetical protein VN886_05670 [Acidimicrobiales bacterium]|nr:hypothetical protein [Acidimicrobiales bacterium]